MKPPAAPKPEPKAAPKPAAKPGPKPIGTASASVNGQTACLAVDGKADTRWDSMGPMKGREWFALELPEEKQILKLTLDTKGSKDDYPRGYEVFVGKTWGGWGKKPVATGKGKGPVTTINLKSAKGRFIKIVQTGKDPKNFWSIHELTVATK